MFSTCFQFYIKPSINIAQNVCAIIFKRSLCVLVLETYLFCWAHCHSLTHTCKQCTLETFGFNYLDRRRNSHCLIVPMYRLDLDRSVICANLVHTHNESLIHGTRFAMSEQLNWLATKLDNRTKCQWMLYNWLQRHRRHSIGCSRRNSMKCAILESMTPSISNFERKSYGCLFALAKFSMKEMIANPKVMCITAQWTQMHSYSRICGRGATWYVPKSPFNH